jgi:hypothetical protein
MNLKEAERKMQGKGAPPRSFEGPYKPSWIDMFNHWVDGLPVNLWVFHFLLAILLILVHVLFLWLEDSLFTGEIFPIVFFNSLAIPYLLVLIFLLDREATNTLQTLRPVLVMSQEEVASYGYKLSTMPFLAPLAAGTLVMVSTILLPSVTISPFRYAVLNQLPIFLIVFHIFDKCSAFLFGVFIYHTIRQLRLVNEINNNTGNINLFNLNPFQDFSKLTGYTAIGLLVFVYP